jgi:hypothetical protein
MTGLSMSLWGTVDVMPIVVQLLGRDGKPLRRLPDPAGGTFDAAGDFDRLIEESTYPALSAIDLYAETIWHSSSMPALLADIEAALPVAKDGPERRGLLRFQVLAERCRDDDLALAFVGD